MMEIRNINIKDTPDNISKFIQDVSRPKYNSNILKWQYGDVLSNLFIIKNKEFLGTQGMIRMNLFCKQHQSFITHKSETTYVSSKLRGTGKFKELYDASINDAKQKGSQMIWGFTALGNLWEKKLNFCSVKIIAEANLIIGTPKDQSFFKAIYCFLKARQTAFKLLFTSIHNIEINEVKFNDFNFIENYKNEWASDEIFLDYKSKSVHSRVFDSPFIRYRLIEFKKAENLISHIIFHITNGVFVISEIFVKDMQELDFIFKKVFEFAKIKNVKIIRFWGNKNVLVYGELFKIFTQFGGRVELVEDMQFVFKNFTDNSFDKSFNKFHINSLWTEGFNY